MPTNMESTRSKTAIMGKVLRIVYALVLLAHLLMWAMGEARGSNSRTGWSPALLGQDKIALARAEPGTKSQESRLVGSKLESFSLNAVGGNMGESRCAYPP